MRWLRLLPALLAFLPGRPCRFLPPPQDPKARLGGWRGGGTNALREGNISRIRFIRRRSWPLHQGHRLLLAPLYAVALKWCLASVGQPYVAALKLAMTKKLEGIEPDQAVGSYQDLMLELLEDISQGAQFEDIYMPGQYLPGVKPTLLLLSTALCHVLIELCQDWSVLAKVRYSYKEVLSLEDADAVFVEPLKHYGDPAIVPLMREGQGADLSEESEEGLFDYPSRSEEEEEEEDKEAADQSESQGNDADVSGAPYFVYQHRKFMLDSEAGGFRLVRLPTQLKLGEYAQSLGLRGSALAVARERFGGNDITLPTPSFGELLKKQLFSPFTTFQLMSQVLWLLESYWTVSLFSVGQIVGMEAMGVYQTRVNQKQLRAEEASRPEQKIQAFRDGSWLAICTKDLLPGDMVSLSCGTGKDQVSTVPVDLLVLRGTAIADEATLTGESVPQLKSSLVGSAFQEEDCLDMGGAHKAHVLLAGTSLLQHSGVDADPEAQTTDLLPETPDGGCLAYVLRTGFYSSEGELLRMVGFSGQQVTSGSRDAALLLMFLLSFAGLAAGYVVKKGLAEGSKSGFRLLLQCVRILTSVVGHRAHLLGALTHLLDHSHARVYLLCPPRLLPDESLLQPPFIFTPSTLTDSPPSVPPEINMELTNCVNSSLRQLIKHHGISCTEPFRIPLAGSVDICLFDKTGTLTSDELQAEAVVEGVEGISTLLGSTDGEMPSLASQVVMGGCHSILHMEGKATGDPLELSALDAVGWGYDSSTEIASASSGGNSTEVASAAILRRFPFDSGLQRMSVLAEVDDGQGGEKELWSLIKGSPEAIGPLLNEESTPSWYKDRYAELASQGKRVLALAYRRHDGGVTSVHPVSRMARGECEAEGGCQFAGLLSFQCKTRSDSAMALEQLRTRAGASTALVTGDSVLTAAHVAREVGIIGQSRVMLVKGKRSKRRRSALLLAASADGTLQWESLEKKASKSKPVKSVKFSLSGMPKLAQKHDLCVTGPALSAALEQSPELLDALQDIKVFARMSPDQKELLTSSLKSSGHTVMMCGDGANDVGALKQAHVGLALLAGFGTANTGGEGEAAAQSSDGAMDPKQLRKAKAERMQRLIEEEHSRMQQEGEKGGYWTALKTVMKQEAAKQKQQRKSFAASAAAAMREGDEDEDKVGNIKAGDASLAAPFTCKKPSVTPALDLIKQGRCTLAALLQTYQMTALDALISAYSLSVMYFDSVKFGERQMMALGMAMSAAYISLSKVRPVEDLALTRPQSSIFHPSIIGSVLGQFAIHTACTVGAVCCAKAYAPLAAALPAGPKTGKRRGLFKSKFTPNLVSNVVFIMSGVQSAVVCFVNYKGQPFMKGVAEVPGLLYSLAGMLVGAAVLLSEAFRPLNVALQLSPFPCGKAKVTIAVILLFNIIGTFVWDRTMMKLFDPALFKEKHSKPLSRTARRNLFSLLPLGAAALQFAMQFQGEAAASAAEAEAGQALE